MAEHVLYTEILSGQSTYLADLTPGNSSITAVLHAW